MSGMAGRWQWLVLALLILAVLTSSLGVVYSTYRSRLLFNDWQQLQRRAWALDEEWEKLLLEQGAWAAHERIRTLAEQRLNMVIPEAGAIKVVGDGN